MFILRRKRRRAPRATGKMNIVSPAIAIGSAGIEATCGCPAILGRYGCRCGKASVRPPVAPTLRGPCNQYRRVASYFFNTRTSVSFHSKSRSSITAS